MTASSRLLQVLSWLLCLGLILAGPAAAQTGGTLSGTVVDSGGGALVGAIVTVRGGGGERTTTTNARGEFTIDGLPDGPVTVVVTFDMFTPATLPLQAPRTGLRVTLQPFAVVEAVTVLAPSTALRSRTATKTDTPLQDVPQAISVVSRELIQAQAMRGMADLVNYVPGVGMAQGEGHRDAPIFRGNTSTSDFYVDGVRDDTQYLRDLYNVDRVEVLKGPNGMVFGRGGVGGVINRVTRQAEWMPTREVVLQGGSWGQKRLSADLGQAFGDGFAARVTGVYEGSDTYRGDSTMLERYGLNPTVAFRLGNSTVIRGGYEYFSDERTVDRGVPSLQGRPLDVSPSTFFGDVDANRSTLSLNAATAGVEHRFNNAVTLRNQLRFAAYDKLYRNTVPGAVDAAAGTFALSAYRNGTDRKNLFNQTDLTLTGNTGGLQHTVLAGLELGRQVTDNRRLTGYFPTVSATTTSIPVALSSPTISIPVEFRAAASDADNHGIATVAGFYVQDQVALTRHVEAIAGVRFDHFEVDFTDNRTDTRFGSTDNLVSPRVGLIVKPVEAVSLYTSYSLTYLPRAGEQLSSLTLTNQALDPENFRNVEAGVKWQVKPAFSLTGAIYRLVHGNVVVADAVDPTLSHLVDAERTIGLELEAAGRLTDRWTLQGGYAYQDAEITRSMSASAQAGAQKAQVPRHSFSLWNRYDLHSRLGVGLGIVSVGDRFVATDNTVVLPSFTRVDAAVFATLTPRVRAHVNIENLFDERYYWAAHNNNNIAPGSPRALRVSLTTQF